MHPAPSRARRRLAAGLLASTLLTTTMVAAGPAPAGAAAPTELFFSEYVEGSSNNKALEIYNGTGAPIDLGASGYSVQMSFNGSPTAGLTVPLSGTVATGDVFVLAQASASATILAQADQTSAASWFNGDDAVTLRKGSVVVDSLGQVGVDPGTEWGTGLTSTADNTLRRKAAVTAGDPVATDAFDPAVQWDGFAVDTFTGLGAHVVDTGPPPADAPVAATCPATLAARTGTATTAPVSATDPDDRVVSASLVVTPAAEGITLADVVPAAADGGTSTAELTVAATVPAGSYQAQLTFSNDGTTPQTATCTVTITVAVPVREVQISEIQGAAHTSPLTGTTVATTGVVTALRSNGYYLQDPTPDTDPATSEGLFVFTGGAPTVAVGSSLRVEGSVAEFQPGGASSGNLTTTQLARTSATVLSSGDPVPAPTVIGAGGRVPPNVVIDDDGLTSFDEDTDGIDFYESLEGMLVQVDDGVAVGPTNDFGEVFLIPDGGTGAGPRTARGGIVVTPTDFNPERIQVDDTRFPTGASMPALDTGQRFGGSIVGPLDYSFGNFEILPSSVPGVVGASPVREVTNLVGAPGKLTVASYNVENFDAADGPARADELAGQIVGSLGSPDLLGLQEIQDDNGARNDAVTSAQASAQALIDAIVRAGGPTYRYADIAPVDDQDGGEPGGNIRVGYLFRTDRGLALVERPGGSATTDTNVVSGPAGPQLTVSPGRVMPTDPAFASSRKPLAAEFTYNGAPLFVVNNHFNSKGGDQPLFGMTQPPVRSSEVQRRQQAAIVNDFVEEILAVDAGARVVVLGDLNDFWFSEVLDIVKGDDLVSLYDGLPVNERYSYDFQGNSQTLDHILVSKALVPSTEFDIVHTNSEFVDQVSDHDPLVARLAIAAPAISVGDASVVEGDLRSAKRGTTTELTFTVRLDRASTAPVTAAYGTQDGTATAGSDYGSTAGSVTFAPGEVAKEVTVSVLRDNRPEGDETFSLVLGAVTGATVADGVATGTIDDDDGVYHTG